MRITHLHLINWRNFPDVEFDLGERLMVVGANASGKSNLLDAFGFLSDVASYGGGLASAIDARGGIGAVRNAHTSHDHARCDVTCDVTMAHGDDVWRYRLSIRGVGPSTRLAQVADETVWLNGTVLLRRPDGNDRDDLRCLEQTHLEQVSINRQFRMIADFLAQAGDLPSTCGSVDHGHVERAMHAAIPDAGPLPPASDGFAVSDGTRALAGLLQTLMVTSTTGGLLLLDGPEQLLNPAIVRRLPEMFATAGQDGATQLVLSTHAREILDDETIRASEILVLQPTRGGATARLLCDVPQVRSQLTAGIPVSEVVGQLIDPSPRDLNGLVRAVDPGAKRRLHRVP